MFNLFKKLQAQSLDETAGAGAGAGVPSVEELNLAREALTSEIRLLQAQLQQLNTQALDYQESKEKIEFQIKANKKTLDNDADLQTYAKKLVDEKNAEERKIKESGTSIDGSNQATQNVEEEVKKLKVGKDELKNELNKLLDKAKTQFSNSQSWANQMLNSAFNIGHMHYYENYINGIKSVLDGFEREEKELDKLSSQINLAKQNIEALTKTLKAKKPNITKDEIEADPDVKACNLEIAKLEEKQQVTLKNLQEKHSGVAKTKEHWKINEPRWWHTARERIDMNIQKGENVFDVRSPTSRAAATLLSPVVFTGSALLSVVNPWSWGRALNTNKKNFLEHVTDGLKENWNSARPVLFENGKIKTNVKAIDAATDRVMQEAGENQPDQTPKSN